MKNSQYRKLLASIDALEGIVADADDEVVVDELTEQAPEEVEVQDVEADADELEEAIKAAEEMIGDDEDIVVGGDEEVENAEDDVDEDIAIAEDVLAPVADDAEVALPDDDDDIVSDEEVKEVLDACDELEDQLGADAVTASEVEPGVEDKIGDEAKGGDPSVSDLPETQIDTATNAEVYPTESEYVARVTARLDKIATALERKGLKRMAFRVDKLSDELENSIR